MKRIDEEYFSSQCETCGEESFAGVCQGCQEVESCCDCTKLSKEEYQEWLKSKSQGENK